jgi:hypothetical protein
MIGKTVYFKDARLGVIVEAKYAPTAQWGMAWTFKLDNNHWIGDIRKPNLSNGNWTIQE